MEPRKRTSSSKKSSITDKGSTNKKLDKLAEDVRKLPLERQKKLKDLIGKQIYSTENAAKKLGISLSTLRRLIRAGLISFFRVGRRIRIDSNEIERFQSAITLKDAADILGVHPLTITRLINRGKLPAYRIGRPYRINISDLEKFMQQKDVEENDGDTIH